MDDIPVASNLRSVQENIQKATQAANRDTSSVRLVAVSKTKPIELLRLAYEAGSRVFGENYAQELVDKVPQMPTDVQWHFIGGLQSNKANMIVKAFDGEHIQRLVVETVDKFKLAAKLNTAVAANTESPTGKLKIFVQVNTSGEESKSGCEPSEVVELCQQIVQECPHLELRGLMTIGAPGDLSCFTTLTDARNQVAEVLQRGDLELSMGMSGDYKEAIAAGATNVRVGSTIFGERDYTNRA